MRQKILDDQRGSPRFALFKRAMQSSTLLCNSITGIEVKESRVTVASDLEEGSGNRSMGWTFCNLVRGSDVADFTDGHELQDAGGETLKVCGARNLP